ncbi:aldo/keto reductase [Streptomyces scopuliridis]|uniref:aldo/keto reductase n=1 Tax=Streptomyces scopuliridis TaxID=452529 RepID=UPI0036921CB7
MGPDVPGRRRPVGRADRPADRRLTAPSAHRLRGPLPGPHRFDSDTPVEETLEAFQRVVDQGKARYLGFSEWTPEQIRTAIDIAGPDLFVASQPQYSMLWQAPEREVFPLAAAHHMSQVVWSPLAQGILTGKYLPGRSAPAGSRFADPATSVTKDVVWSEAALEAVDRALGTAPVTEPTLATAATPGITHRDRARP